MNRLYVYLRTLPQEKRNILGSLELSGRQSETLGLLLSTLDGVAGGQTKESTRERLAMSSAMFDKTCSQLLASCYRHLVPTDDLDRLGHLRDLALLDHFRSELRRLARTRSGDREVVRRLYYGAFGIVCSRFAGRGDLELAREIGAEILSLDPDSVEIALYVQTMIWSVDMWETAFVSPSDAEAVRLGEELEVLEGLVTEVTWAKTRLRLLRNRINFHGQVRFDTERRGRLIEEAIEFCELEPSIEKEESIALDRLRAEHAYFFEGDHERAWKLYNDHFVAHPSTIEDDLYATAKFVQLSLITGRHDRAATLLEESERRAPRVGDVGTQKTRALMRALLALMLGDLVVAHHWIDRAGELNEKLYFVAYEIQHRMLLTAWFALKGDVGTVEDLVPAHLKYLRSKGYLLKSSRLYPWFFTLTRAILQEKSTGKRLTPLLRRKYEEYQTGAAAQFGVLLRIMRSDA